MKELHDLRDKLCDELKDYGRKDISAGTLDVVDKLTHTIKNLDKIIEVDEDGYSGYYPYSYDRGSYARGRNVRRDSMGRYSGDGYSRSDLTENLRDLMADAPDERTRAEIKRLIDKM